MRAGLTAAALVALVLAACDSGGSPAPTTTTTTPPTTVTEHYARGEPDGILTIGVLLPKTGTGASLGEPLSEVVEGAVRAINADGGVAGNPVELLMFDEAAATSVDDLLGDASIDAVVGPASSRNALAMLPTITDAGVAACSPMATSIALTRMPDSGLFFRTVPSDALQARFIAGQIDQTGLGTAAVVYTDDVYGRPFGAAVRDALEALPVPVVTELAYQPDDDDFSDDAAEILAENPPVVALVGDAESGGRMVAALLAAGAGEAKIIASDAVRVADFGTRIDLDDLAARVSGVSVSAYEGRRSLGFLDPDIASAAFAAAAVDCVNLLALGAIAAESPDEPTRIVSEALALSVGGASCQSFAECRAAMDGGLEVDYNGPTGSLALDAAGDVTQASFDIWEFDDTGTDVTTRRCTTPTDRCERVSPASGELVD